MSKYSPALTPGAVRIRVKSATLDNTYGRNPYVIWQREEQIMCDDGQYRYAALTELHTEITPELLATVMPVYDLDTGEPQAEAPAGLAVGLLQSLFVLANEQSIRSGPPVYVEEGETYGPDNPRPQPEPEQPVTLPPPAEEPTEPTDPTEPTETTEP